MKQVNVFAWSHSGATCFLKCVVCLCAAISSSIAAAAGAQTAPATKNNQLYSPYANQAFPSKVLFGDVHVHTGLSGDAGGSGTRLMPRDAYRFARGERILSNSGQAVRISQPYDFLAIADHTDGMGVILDILAGTPNIRCATSLMPRN